MIMEQSSIVKQAIERRSKPRIYCSYPAIVQGKDINGKKFRANAILTNISATGLCLLLRPEIQQSGDLFVLFRYSATGPLGDGKAPLIAVRGSVVRSSYPVQGMHSVAIKIRRNRFL